MTAYFFLLKSFDGVKIVVDNLNIYFVRLCATFGAFVVKY